MLGGDESRHRNRRLQRRGCGGLRRGDVPYLANLAMLLVRSLRVPVRERVGRQRAHRQDERDRQHASDCYSLRYAQTRPGPRPYCS